MLEIIPWMICEYNGGLCPVNKVVDKLWKWKILFVAIY